MASVTVLRDVAASPAVAFDVVANPRRFCEAISGVKRLEMLSDIASGVGTRYRVWRVQGSREWTLDFEVTEHVPNRRVRIVNVARDVVWDSVFTVEPRDAGSRLMLRMTASSRKLGLRLLLPLVCLLVRRGVARDVDALRAFIERPVG